MKKPTAIFLVGLPGSGKTTVGRELAERLGYTFLDLDREIERIEEMSITNIFKSKDEMFFRELERVQLRNLKLEDIVVSTGGGTPCYHENMAWMVQNGLTIFLNPPLEFIAHRISGHTHRPLIGPDPIESIQLLYENRLGWYQKSETEIVQTDPIKTVAELLAAIQKED